MPFNRPPRIQSHLPEDTVEIPPPPSLPATPGAFGWLTTLLPVGGSVLVAGLMLVAGGGGGAGYFLMLPTMVVGAAAAWINYRNQKREHQTGLEKAKSEYRDSIQRAENRLLSLRERERQIRLEVNPDVEDCCRRICNRDTRLGERRPGDPDFLHLRLGRGPQAANFQINTAEKKNRPDVFLDCYGQADGLAERFRKIPDAPFLLCLPRLGSVGICGNRQDTISQTRALLCQLATHHWPFDVQVAALCITEHKLDWAWMQSLPHAATAFDWVNLPVIRDDQPPTPLLAALESELLRRRQTLTAQRMVRGNAVQIASPLPNLVIVFDHLPSNFSHPGLNVLLREGRELGVFGIFLTDAPDRIPGECNAILRVRGRDGSLEECGPASQRREYQPDSCSGKIAEQIARALTRIEWPAEQDLSQPPAMVSLLGLLGAQDAADVPVEQWWDAGSPFGFLRAPIGKTSPTADFLFDIKDQDGSHGPHGLIGGMTGSGKSEVLKSVILALAVTHHPYDLNFVLIDYKGGAAFNELAQLPHTVGVVTDIESHASYAERILAALSGEVERRKKILERARGIFRFGRSHVDEYRALRVRQPLPHLVIVFDEFAEFRSRHPEESKRLISIARLGRSLGVHLILATQNIQAAIDPQILQNSTFRICLKVSQAEDSMQMVGVPDAIQLPRGRAIFHSQGRATVQIAYSGGPYQPGHEAADPEPWVRIRRDGRREPIPARQAGESNGRNRQREPMTEANALVDRMNRAMQTMRLRKPPAVWHDPLPKRIYLPDLLHRHVTGGWDGEQWHPSRRLQPADERTAPILGLVDLPEKQEQPVLELSSESNAGHLLVFGSAGSGKTTLIRTLVASIAHLRSPGEAHIYILDCGSQSALRLLAAFPHVGAVISQRENERAERLIGYLHREVTRRSELFRRLGVNNREDYNRQAGTAAKLPEIHLIVDGFLELKRAFPPEFIHAIHSLVGGGTAVGLRMVLSAYQQSDIPNDLFANIGMRVTFHQPSQAEYAGLVGVPGEARIQEEAGSAPLPGRGLLKGKPPVDWQAALPVAGETEWEQISRLTELAEQMRAAWTGPLPEPILNLPDHVVLTNLLEGPKAPAPFFSPLGIGFDSLDPVGFSLSGDGPTFLIAGSTPQSGKTTLLRTWLLGLSQRYSPERIRFILVDFHTRTLKRFRKDPHTAAYIGQASELNDALQDLLADIKARASEADRCNREDPDAFERSRWLEQLPMTVVVIDDYEKFSLQCESERRLLADCLMQGGELGMAFIAAGNATELPRDYDDPLIQKMRKHGCGVLLNGITEIDQFNNARLPAFQKPGGMPPGRGYLIRRGRVQLFQSAAYWEADSSPKEALACLTGQAGG